MLSLNGSIWNPLSNRGSFWVSLCSILVLSVHLGDGCLVLVVARSRSLLSFVFSLLDEVLFESILASDPNRGEVRHWIAVVAAIQIGTLGLSFLTELRWVTRPRSPIAQSIRRSTMMAICIISRWMRCFLWTRAFRVVNRPCLLTLDLCLDLGLPFHTSLRQLISRDFRCVFAAKCFCLDICRSGSWEENRLGDVLHVISHDSCADVWGDLLLFTFAGADL